jgi:hypothetical protein
MMPGECPIYAQLDIGFARAERVHAESQATFTAAGLAARMAHYQPRRIALNEAWLEPELTRIER